MLIQLLCSWTLFIGLFLFKSTYNASETGFCRRLQVEPTHLGPIDRHNPVSETLCVYLNKNRTLDNVQKHNNCIPWGAELLSVSHRIFPLLPKRRYSHDIRKLFLPLVYHFMTTYISQTLGYDVKFQGDCWTLNLNRFFRKQPSCNWVTIPEFSRMNWGNPSCHDRWCPIQDSNR
jgi:hypothetical protein